VDFTHTVADDYNNNRVFFGFSGTFD
jgi:hypothetical protein